MIDRARVLGKKCYLRPLEREDLTDDYLSWVNDISTNGYIHATGFPVNRELLEEYFEAAKPPGVVMFAVCDIETHKHIGNARLSYIDWVHRTARYGWLIGASGKRGRGIGSEALVLLLRFGFHHLGMNRIWSAVALENEASVLSTDRVGMTREGILRQFMWANGRFLDTYSYSMLRSEFDELHGLPETWSKRELEIKAKLQT